MIEMSKRLEVEERFKCYKFDLLGLCETKLKGKEEFDWNGIHGVRTGVEQGERAREGVALLMSDKWYEKINLYECVDARILMVKFKFDSVKVAVIIAYTPCEYHSEEVMDDF